jgi:hypothetical protein
MLKFSKQREHCLISSLQLLGLYYEVLKNPSKKDELIKLLFETIGVYDGFEDWSEFISLQETATPSTSVGASTTG